MNSEKTNQPKNFTRTEVDASLNQGELSLVDRIFPRGNRLRIGLGLFLTILGTAFLVMRIHTLEQQVKPKIIVQENILVASQDISPGTIITREMLDIQELPADFVHPKSILPQDLSLILGRTTSEGISKAEPIIWSSLLAETTGELRMASMVRLGERAVALPVDQIASVGYFIMPGDRVDIFLIARRRTGQAVVPILQNVSILATGNALSSQSIGGQYSRIVVSVTPREAEMLLLAQRSGQIQLLLRNEHDVEAQAEFPILHEHELLGEEVRKQVQTQRNERVKIIQGNQT